MTVSSARGAFFEVARTAGAGFTFTNPGTTEPPIFDEFADRAAGLELFLCLTEANGYAQATNSPTLVNLHILPCLAGGLCHG